ncbi:MAG: peptide deformylase [Spirochaetota bacterium]
MAVKRITLVPESVLYRKAGKVKVVNDDIRALARDMADTLNSTTGVGIAAPQIGVSSRLVIVKYGDEDDETVNPVTYIVVNPEITDRSEDMIGGIEGCLSVPGVVGEVDRHYSLTVRGLDLTGNKVKIAAQGWLARIFQHEIDHLDGILYTDRASRVWHPEDGNVIDDV